MQVTREVTCAPRDDILLKEIEDMKILNKKERQYLGRFELYKLDYDPDTVDDPKECNENKTISKANEEKNSKKIGDYFPLFSSLESSSLMEDDITNFKQMISDLETKQRKYLLYVPKDLNDEQNQGKQDTNNVKTSSSTSTSSSSTTTSTSFGVIVLLHGTDETCTTTELVRQNDGKMSWMDVADRFNYFLLIPQSRGLKEKYMGGIYEKSGPIIQMNWVWQPGMKDLIYLKQVMKHFKSHNYFGPKINRNKVFAVGFSNGGLWTSDLLLNYVNKNDYSNHALASKLYEKQKKYSNQDSISIGRNLDDNEDNELKFVALCNFMGGLPSTIQKCIYEAKQKKQQDPYDISISCPMYIITGSNDDNRMPCIKCNEYLQSKNHPVKFDIIPNQHHEVVSYKTEEIMQFFEQFTIKSTVKIVNNTHHENDSTAVTIQRENGSETKLLPLSLPLASSVGLETERD